MSNEFGYLNSMKINLGWLDKVSLLTLIIITAFLGLAPFIPEPHVWEKLKMLSAGTLHRPIDIFDLFLHGTPWVLVGLKLFRMKQSQGPN